jgi:hypothetical protein
MRDKFPLKLCHCTDVISACKLSRDVEKNRLQIMVALRSLSYERCQAICASSMEGNSVYNITVMGHKVTPGHCSMLGQSCARLCVWGWVVVR